MVFFPNDDSSTTPPDNTYAVQPKQYRANIFFQGKLVFAIYLVTVNYHQFLGACQQLLFSQLGIKLGIKQEIRLWCLDKISGTSDCDKTSDYDMISDRSRSTTTPYKISSDLEFRNVFGRGSCQGETMVRNFVITCEVATGKDTGDALKKKETCKEKFSLNNKSTRKLDKEMRRDNVMQAFRKLEVEASRSRNLQSQLRLLNRAFKQIMSPKRKNAKTCKSSVVYERRRRQFAAMLVTMRKRPLRASAWVGKMQRQHAGNPRMSKILSILNIFVNNLQ